MKNYQRSIVIVSLIALAATAIYAADATRTRLDNIIARRQIEIEKASEVFNNRIEKINASVAKIFNIAIDQHRQRDENDKANQLQQELDTILAQKVTPSPPTPHGKLIKTLGPSIVNPNNESLPTSLLSNYKYIALYFSASWCPPCKTFTPKLVRFYNDNKSDSNFEIILVSSDRSEKDMLAYMNNDNMAWLAVPFRKIRPSGLHRNYGGPGIPNLVILDADNNVISGSYVNGRYVGPTKVMNDLKKLIE